MRRPVSAEYCVVLLGSSSASIILNDLSSLYHLGRVVSGMTWEQSAILDVPVQLNNMDNVPQSIDNELVRKFPRGPAVVNERVYCYGDFT